MSQPDAFRLLTDLLNESYRARAWHGTNLRGSIRGLTAREAARRPASGRHNIWEIVIHCAYWKYVVRRRILGEKKGSFYRKGSNWFKSPSASNAREWKHDVMMLNLYHEKLMEVLPMLRAADLPKTPAGSSVSTAAILRGIASHDVYHAGQIQLLKRLVR